MGSIPSAEDLLSAIRAAPYTEAEWRTLASLYAGDDDDGDGSGPHDSELDDFRLFGVIGCNSFGEEFTDFPTALARSQRPQPQPGSQPGARQPARTEDEEEQPLTDHAVQQQQRQEREQAAQAQGGQVGHLGLFPSFSMLNHSCLPNAVNFVVGSGMVVVAARAIPKGSEVLINYLGRASLRPVEERQEQLAEGYHFSCDCPRCRAELLAQCDGAGAETEAEAEAEAGTGRAAGFGDAVQELLDRCAARAEALRNMPPPSPGAPDTSGSSPYTPPSPQQQQVQQSGTHTTVAATPTDASPSTTPSSPFPHPALHGPVGQRGPDLPAGDLPASHPLDLSLAEVRQDVGLLEELVRNTAARLPPTEAADTVTAAIIGANSTPAGPAAPTAADAGPGAGDQAERLTKQHHQCQPRYQQEHQAMVAMWLRASAFDLLSQHVALAEAAGRRGEALEALGAQLAVCEAVAPHSDLHMYLAVKHLAMVQQVAGGIAADEGELGRCLRVVRGRYGADLSDGTAALLLEGAAYGLSQVMV